MCLLYDNAKITILRKPILLFLASHSEFAFWYCMLISFGHGFGLLNSPFLKKPSLHHRQNKGDSLSGRRESFAKHYDARRFLILFDPQSPFKSVLFRFSRRHKTTPKRNKPISVRSSAQNTSHTLVCKRR